MTVLTSHIWERSNKTSNFSLFELETHQSTKIWQKFYAVVNDMQTFLSFELPLLTCLPEMKRLSVTCTWCYSAASAIFTYSMIINMAVFQPHLNAVKIIFSVSTHR